MLKTGKLKMTLFVYFSSFLLRVTVRKSFVLPFNV